MSPSTRPALAAILELVARARSVDFNDYRKETVERRVAHRIAASGSRDEDDYRARLERDPAELDHLVRALLIPVTSFFRDGAVFEALAKRVIGDLLASGAPTVRAWVIGAATGEEAWTLAMLLARACAAERERAFEVLATDLDESSLESAREGVYPREAAAHLPRELVDRFLEPRGDGLRVRDELRPFVRFVRHDVVGPRLAPREAVLASFDLVLCRNVLIYFDERLRGQALARIATVLRPGGALVLGSAESVPSEDACGLVRYPALDAALRVYRRVGGGP